MSSDAVLSRNDIRSRDPAPMPSRMDGSNMCMWKASVSSLSCFCGCAVGYPPGGDEHEMMPDGEGGEFSVKVTSRPEAAYSHNDLIDGILHGYREAMGLPQVIKEVMSIVSTKEPAGPRPEFTGKYILSKVEGEPEKGLQNTGVGYMQRKAAGAAGFGVNKVNVEVKQDGDEIKISSSTPLGSSTVSFRVGGGKQKNKASDGGEFVLDPVWEGDKLKAHMQRGQYETKLTRYMRGDAMIIESVTNGTYPNNMVREIYTRKP